MVGMGYLRMSRIEDPVAMDGREKNPFGRRWKRGGVAFVLRFQVASFTIQGASTLFVA